MTEKKDLGHGPVEEQPLTAQQQQELHEQEQYFRQAFCSVSCLTETKTFSFFSVTSIVIEESFPLNLIALSMRSPVIQGVVWLLLNGILPKWAI